MLRRTCNSNTKALPGWCAIFASAALIGSLFSGVAFGFDAPPLIGAPVRTAAPYAATPTPAAPYPTAPTLGNAPIIRATPSAQAAAPVAPRPAPLPEPIYWRQHLFLIPYQWGSAAESGVAQAVYLFVSKDRGATWRKISEAKPDVKAFNYRAEGDGEYWFAVRTVDRQGRAWPAGAYLPELRVIVDTTLPNIDALHMRTVDNGRFEIRSRATDLNLDPNSWRFEWQADANSAWQPVTLQSVVPQQPGAVPELQAYWLPPAGARPLAIRGTVSDRAGNSATYQTRMDAPAMSGPLLAPPVIGSSTPQSTATIFPNVPAAPLSTTWPRLSETRNGTNEPAPSQPTAQPWAATNTARAPIQLWTSNLPSKDDGVTSYGMPPIFNAPGNSISKTATLQSPPRTEARFAAMTKPAETNINSLPAFPPTRPEYATLEPYREPATPAQPSFSRDAEALRSEARPNQPTLDTSPSETNTNPWQPVSSAPAEPQISSTLVPLTQPAPRDVTPIDSSSSRHTPMAAPKLVGSRTFALEYDLDNAGAGVSRVELWGTRDGGKTWTLYTQDDDNRSPLVVTVDDEGLYGFRIVVQTAGSTLAEPPRSGDAPELWVAVDLKCPTVELTAVERGQGNIGDHLILHWRAADNNLEPHPIALFYSSQPSGPWSAIATNLENTGEYSWRVERYVPSRFYLRVEAHDTAGNLAAFQTREPIEFSPPNLAAGHLRAAEPVNSANAAAQSYH